MSFFQAVQNNSENIISKKINLNTPSKLRTLLLYISSSLTLLFFLFIFGVTFNAKIASAIIMGDINLDGTVNVLDFALLVDAYATSLGETNYNSNANLNGDFVINVLDLVIFVENYGKSEPIASPNPSINPTRTPTTITPTRTPTPLIPTTTLQPPPLTSGGMWISKQEILQLPTSGSAWTNLKSAAYSSWGAPDLKNQDNKYGLKVLAGALVYVRTGDLSLRTKTKDGIIAAKRTIDEPIEYQAGFTALSITRQDGTYPIAADLIDLKNFDASADNELRSWLKTIRTQNVSTHSKWKNLTHICENSANNWGTFACPSRLAASIYLGDTADVQRTANIIRAFMGERQYYPPDAPGQNGYFQITQGGAAGAWYCGSLKNWTAINPSCSKLGINIDGALVDDASRGGSCCNLQGLAGGGFGYSWEALQGLYVSAELLYRTGKFGNPYTWSNNALKRSMDHMQRQGWNIGNVANYVPWIANKRYGTSYSTTSTGTGRIMSWTDWTHQ